MKLFESKDRTCVICGEPYHGFRDICDEPKCYWDWKTRAALAKESRPRDYVATRPPFLVTVVPKDKV